jgi:8-oxo-dGTP pyrophosphatase MutT (NUDIX family)
MSEIPNKTLVFLWKPQEQKILLAMKKRGFGEGKWNGVGGKLESGETIEQAAIRETKEEIGVHICEENLCKRGYIDFSFENKPDWSQRVHVFFVEVWDGDPEESEEMRPEWYHFESIPYKEMWIDDEHWLPKAIEQKSLKDKFHFNEHGTEIILMEI